MRLQNSRRGFVFTVMALALLSFMLVSVQVWTQAFGQSDLRAAERFKGESMRLVLASLSDKEVSDFARASAFYATYKLANYSAVNGLVNKEAADADNKGTGLVEKTLMELMMNGSSAPSDPAIEYSQAEKDAYTVKSWKEKVQSASSVMGFEATFTGPTNPVVRQIDPWTIGVTFNIDLDISDRGHTMHQSKQMTANATFPISGFLDPSITRNDIMHRSILRSAAEEKQIFKNPAYDESSDVAPVVIGRGRQGNGWFFGPATHDYPDTGIFIEDDAASRISQYVLVAGAYDDKLPQYAESYGAVVLLFEPDVINYSKTDAQSGCVYNVTEETKCLNCEIKYQTTNAGCNKPTEYNESTTTTRPVLVVNRDWKNPISFSRAGMTPSTESYLLIDNSYGTVDRKKEGAYHQAWDVTSLRDMAICGFYVHSQEAPSFFQRMLASVGTSTPGFVKSDKYGIESFVVGKWAGGAGDQGSDNRPRLDWQFYSAATDGDFETTLKTTKIKGMMGCKSAEMCGGTNATTDGVGKFSLTVDVAGRYGVSQIACTPPPGYETSAPCEIE